MSGSAQRGVVVAVCVSRRKGTAKEPRKRVRAVVGHGLAGDAHAGPWHRQVSLLAKDGVDFMRARGAPVTLGSFGENLVVDGLDLHRLPVGTELRAGRSILLKVTQIGKECHAMCAIGRAVGTCIMPERGIFCEVLAGGYLRPGDPLEVVRDDTA